MHDVACGFACAVTMHNDNGKERPQRTSISRVIDGHLYVVITATRIRQSVINCDYFQRRFVFISSKIEKAFIF